METQIQNQQKGFDIELKPLQHLLQHISQALGLEDKELSVVLVDDKQIALLNRQYRKQAGATDVLAFAMQEGEFAEINPQLLGDVVISVETAQRQAKEQQHSLTKELQILLIHGVLHLLGYDHIKQPEAELMRCEELKLTKHSLD